MELILFYSEGKGLDIQLTQSTQSQIGSWAFVLSKIRYKPLLSNFIIPSGVQVSEERNFNI